MDREEVIDVTKAGNPIWDVKKVGEALDRAIKELSAEQVTSKLKKPCDSLLTDDLGECKEQKSKLDLISRAEAKNVIAEKVFKEYTDEFWGVMQVLDELPSADRPSGEWIPCSEKMPEDGQGVIICTDDKRFKDHPVGTCIYEDGRFHTNFHDDISIIAWMPLPKQYCGTKMGGNK